MNPATARTWAWIGVVIGLAASVAGNVANTILTPATSPLGLRVPFAVLWPALVYIGIEVLTRTNWQARWTHWIAKVILIGPISGVAAFVSYLHLRHLMILSGEPGLAQAVGPLAIDGTLIGCTVVLLITNAEARDTPARSVADVIRDLKAQGEEVRLAVLGDKAPEPEVPAIESPEVPALPVPVSPAVPVPVFPAVPRPRRGSWDPVKAVRLLMDGHNNAEVADTVGIHSKQIQRTRRALNAIRADRNAVIPPEWKVPADVVQIIRQEVRP